MENGTRVRLRGTSYHGPLYGTVVGSGTMFLRADLPKPYVLVKLDRRLSGQHDAGHVTVSVIVAHPMNLEPVKDVPAVVYTAEPIGANGDTDRIRRRGESLAYLVDVIRKEPRGYRWQVTASDSAEIMAVIHPDGRVDWQEASGLR